MNKEIIDIDKTLQLDSRGLLSGLPILGGGGEVPVVPAPALPVPVPAAPVLVGPFCLSYL